MESREYSLWRVERVEYMESRESREYGIWRVKSIVCGE